MVKKSLHFSPLWCQHEVLCHLFVVNTPITKAPLCMLFSSTLVIIAEGLPLLELCIHHKADWWTEFKYSKCLNGDYDKVEVKWKFLTPCFCDTIQIHVIYSRCGPCSVQKCDWFGSWIGCNNNDQWITGSNHVALSSKTNKGKICIVK